MNHRSKNQISVAKFVYFCPLEIRELSCVDSHLIALAGKVDDLGLIPRTYII